MHNLSTPTSLRYVIANLYVCSLYDVVVPYPEFWTFSQYFCTTQYLKDLNSLCKNFGRKINIYNRHMSMPNISSANNARRHDSKQDRNSRLLQINTEL